MIFAYVIARGCVLTLQHRRARSSTQININMAAPRNSLRGFLTHAKSALRSAVNSNQKVTLVIGNESAGQHHTCIILASGADGR